jgi:hypothetical protein
MRYQKERDQEISRQIEVSGKLNEFIEKGGGEEAKTFLQHIIMLQKWLMEQKQVFAQYSKNQKELEQFEPVKNRKPYSKKTVLLGLDINPEISKAKLESTKTKRAFYEGIRSSETQLNLTTTERVELLNQIKEWCGILGTNMPPLEIMLFPDMTYSASEANLHDYNYKIKFNPVEALNTLSQISTRINKSYINKYGPTQF